MEAVVEGSKLPVDGFVEQEVDVQLDVLWRAENTVSDSTSRGRNHLDAP